MNIKIDKGACTWLGSRQRFLTSDYPLTIAIIMWNVTGGEGAEEPHPCVPG